MTDRLMEILYHGTGIELMLVSIIGGIGFASLVLLLVSVSRRLYNGHKYRLLDELRKYYLPSLREMALAGKISAQDIANLRARPRSAKWIAIEDTLFLLLQEDGNRSFVGPLFERLGYLAFYRAILSRRNPITQAAGISKLGMLKDTHSAARLLEMLDKNDPEIIVAAVRAFCEIGEVALFPKFFDALSTLLDKRSVTMKIIEASLSMAGREVTPVLLQSGRTCKDPRIVSAILKVLGDASADNSVYEFALSNLGHRDPEVRAKALKVIAACEDSVSACSHKTWYRLLKDSVWFVRLQAVRAVGKQRCKEYTEEISSLVLDEKWQVRNAAAEALTGLGEDAVEIFLKILKSSDKYAKESICEVLQTTGFVERLLSLLEKGLTTHGSSMYEIFKIMASLGFTSQLSDYLNKTEDRSIAVIIDLAQHETAQEVSRVLPIPPGLPSRRIRTELRSAS